MVGAKDRVEGWPRGAIRLDNSDVDSDRNFSCYGVSDLTRKPRNQARLMYADSGLAAVLAGFRGSLPVQPQALEEPTCLLDRRGQWQSSENQVGTENRQNCCGHRVGKVM